MIFNWKKSIINNKIKTFLKTTIEVWGIKILREKFFVIQKN